MALINNSKMRTASEWLAQLAQVCNKSSNKKGYVYTFRERGRDYGTSNHTVHERVVRKEKDVFCLQSFH